MRQQRRNEPEPLRGWRLLAAWTVLTIAAWALVVWFGWLAWSIWKALT